MNSNLTPLDQTKLNIFRRKLLRWFETNGRKFPWRQNRTPYRVIVAEMLLQKTNAAKVVPAYKQLLVEYPTVRSLAAAQESKLEELVKPLGLLYRAHRLKRMAQDVVEKCGGRFPRSVGELRRLYGVGDYMANAVAAFAYEEPAPIVDTNVIRVFARVFGVTSDRPRARTDRLLWRQVGSAVPVKNARVFNLALLDFAALVCTASNPKCTVCPMNKICQYYSKFAQSEVRQKSGRRMQQD